MTEGYAFLLAYKLNRNFAVNKVYKGLDLVHGFVVVTIVHPSFQEEGLAIGFFQMQVVELWIIIAQGMG